MDEGKDGLQLEGYLLLTIFFLYDSNWIIRYITWLPHRRCCRRFTVAFC
jgi:hypothetical protein